MTESNLPPGDSPPPATHPRPLSADDAAQLAGRLAELAAAGLPLAPGLRAAAAELPPGRLADALQSVAAGLQRGQTLDQALGAEQNRLPAYFRGLVAAGVRSGRLGEVLEQFVGFRQFVADTRRAVWLAMAYPLLLLAMTFGLFLFLVVQLVPTVAKALLDLKEYSGYSLDPSTSAYRLPPENLRVLAWLSAHLGIWLPVAVTVVALFLAWCRLGPARRVRWVLNRLPVFGPLWRYGGLAEFARLLRLLIEQNVPLPEALRLTAEGIGDADVAEGCRRLAGRVEAGQSLSSALQDSPQFTPVLRSVIAWGEGHGALPAALEMVEATSVRFVRIWSELLRGTLPPVVFLIVATGVLFFLSLFQGLIVFLTYLASYGYVSSGSNLSQFAPEQAVGVFSLALLGLAILLALRLVYFNRPGRDALYLLLQIVARILLAFAALGFFLIADSGLGLFLWLGALVLWGMVVYRFRNSQRRMLIDLVSLAASRGLPLQGVVQAFADEQPGVIGRRAAGFAERLSAGLPPAEAAQATRRLFPPQTLLAMEIGQQTDSLPAVLQSLGQGIGAPERSKENLAVGLLSLAAVTTWGLMAVLFFIIKVVPAFEKIFSDFRQPLPPLTQHLFHYAGAAAHPALLLEFVLGCGVVVFCFYLPLYEMGWTRSELPPLNRLFAPRHAAVVLRWLAAAVRRGQPLGPTLSLVAARYPNRLIRARLEWAAFEIHAGGDWIGSLRRRKLIRRTDAAILRAAAQAGNLAWALDESAAAAERRLANRLQVIGQFLMPLSILLIGGFVMLFAVGCFLPLVALISGLAKG